MRDRFGDLQRAVPGLEADSELHHGDYFGQSPEDYSTVFDEVEGIRATINDIVLEVAETHRIHNVLLSAAQPDEVDKQDLERITASIKKKAKFVQAKLKAMETSLEEEGVSHTTAEYRIQSAQHASLTRSFISTMSDYNNIQNEYRDRCKERIQRQLKITGNEKPIEEVEEMLENGDPTVFTQGILMETAQAKIAFNEIQERHTAILSLESSIMELHSMFVDMAVLVQQQGELIDRIEFNVVNTEEYTRGAVKKLAEARELQRRTQCCCCLKCCKCCTIL